MRGKRIQKSWSVSDMKMLKHLYFDTDMPVSEMAERMGFSVAAVNAILSRGGIPEAYWKQFGRRRCYLVRKRGGRPLPASSKGGELSPPVPASRPLRAERAEEAQAAPARTMETEIQRAISDRCRARWHDVSPEEEQAALEEAHVQAALSDRVALRLDARTVVLVKRGREQEAQKKYAMAGRIERRGGRGK